MKAERRHQKVRMKKRAERIVRNIFGIKDEKTVQYVSVRHADNLKKCTCEMCKRPRYKRKRRGDLTWDEDNTAVDLAY